MIEALLSGGLGNQLFEYACARSQQLENDEYLVLNRYLLKDDPNGRKYILDKFNISKDIDVISKKREFISFFGRISIYFPEMIYDILSHFGIYIWRKRTYKEIKCVRKNNYLYGYFQSEKYFHKWENVIKKELKVIAPLADCESLLIDIQKSESVCVHIRRGDYIAAGLIVCTKDYYKRGIAYMKERIPNSKFFFFSDDIEWVKENIKMQDAVYIPQGHKEYEDLTLMYNCKYFIISNSSYSWWAQYLSENKDKIVVAPKIWVPCEKDKNDIFMDFWELI